MICFLAIKLTFIIAQQKVQRQAHTLTSTDATYNMKNIYMYSDDLNQLTNYG